MAESSEEVVGMLRRVYNLDRAQALLLVQPTIPERAQPKVAEPRALYVRETRYEDMQTIRDVQTADPETDPFYTAMIAKLQRDFKLNRKEALLFAKPAPRIYEFLKRIVD